MHFSQAGFKVLQEMLKRYFNCLQGGSDPNNSSGHEELRSNKKKTDSSLIKSFNVDIIGDQFWKTYPHILKG